MRNHGVVAVAPRKEVGAAGAGTYAGRAGGGEERHRSPPPAHDTAKRGPQSPPLDGESAAIGAAREKGYWIRSDERRAAQGLESLYALAAQGPQGPAEGQAESVPSGPASRPSRNSLLQIPAFLGRRGAGAEAMG